MKQEPLDQIISGAVPFGEFARYRAMRDGYFARCNRAPAWNRCTIAFYVCADSFNLTMDQIIAHDRFSTDLVETRQRMMAFCRVVSLTAPRPNTWQGIARNFHRTHSTVIHATRKYGDQIAAALEVSK